MSGESSIRELVVLSGKGGTGKTSVTASLAALAEQTVQADCDVDASNLPLVLDPRARRREGFTGGLSARIRPGHCTACAPARAIQANWLRWSASRRARRPARGDAGSS